jgi:hypothetical protein
VGSDTDTEREAERRAPPSSVNRDIGATLVAGVSAIVHIVAMLLDAEEVPASPP